MPALILGGPRGVAARGVREMEWEEKNTIRREIWAAAYGAAFANARAIWPERSLESIRDEAAKIATEAMENLPPMHMVEKY